MADATPDNSMATSAAVSHDDEVQAIRSDLSKLKETLHSSLEIKDRSYWGKSYPKCFLGSDAVKVLCDKGVAGSVEDAVQIGQLMLQAGVLHHVTKDHAFKNERLFYRFSEDEDYRGGKATAADGTPVSWLKVMPQVLGGASDDVENNLQASLVRDDPAAAVADLHAPDVLHQLEVSPLDEHNAKLLDNVHPLKWKDPEPTGKKYNVVVIGAGAAGLVTAAGCAGVGAKVAIIEKNLMGGDCLNVGCVPSKALLKAAHIAHTVRHATQYGVRVTGAVEVDFPAIMARMRALRAQISANDSVERFQKLGVDVFIGHGKFTDSNTVEVNGQKLSFSKAVIATGGWATVPPVPGLKEIPYLTNTTVFNLTSLPARLAVVGAGPIGCELAQAFRRFGSQVTVFERGPAPLPREDEDASGLVVKSMEADGVSFALNSNLKNFRVIKPATDEKQSGSSLPEIEISYSDGTGDKTLIVNAVLVSAGRAANVQQLGLEAAGVKFSRSGVEVNDNLQSSQKHIFAVGDCATKYQFTHVADFMARMVIRNALFYGNGKMSALLIPWCTYTDPEVAHVGLYPSDMKERSIEFDTYTREFADVDRSIVDGTTTGFVKVHTQKGTDVILGATIVGSHAGDMISEVTLAMQHKVGLGSIAAVIHPYPTTADAIRATGDAYNRTRLTPSVKSLFRSLMKFQRAW